MPALSVQQTSLIIRLITGGSMSKGITYSVQITGLPQGGIYQPQEQLDYDSEWRTRLGDAYANKVEARVICLCRGQH